MATYKMMQQRVRERDPRPEPVVLPFEEFRANAVLGFLRQNFTSSGYEPIDNVVHHADRFAAGSKALPMHCKTSAHSKVPAVRSEIKSQKFSLTAYYPPHLGTEHHSIQR